MKSRKVTFGNYCISMTPEKYKFNFNNLSIYINQVIVLKAFFAYEDTCDQTNFYKHDSRTVQICSNFSRNVSLPIFREMRFFNFFLNSQNRLNSPQPVTFFRRGGDLLDDVVLNRYQN